MRGNFLNNVCDAAKKRRHIDRIELKQWLMQTFAMREARAEMVADAYGAWPIEYVCANCGGTDLSFDATAHWNADRQTMEHIDTQDGADCHDCDSEARVIERAIVPNVSTT